MQKYFLNRQNNYFYSIASKPQSYEIRVVNKLDNQSLTLAKREIIQKAGMLALLLTANNAIA